MEINHTHTGGEPERGNEENKEERKERREQGREVYEVLSY
jgi:hypothetical protein